MEIHLMLVCVAVAQYLLIAYYFWSNPTKCAHILYRAGLAASALTAAASATLAWGGVKALGPYVAIVLVGLGAAAGLMYASAKEDDFQSTAVKIKRELYIFGGTFALHLLALVLKTGSRVGGSFGEKLGQEFNLAINRQPPPIVPRRARALSSVLPQEPSRRAPGLPSVLSQERPELPRARPRSTSSPVSVSSDSQPTALGAALTAARTVMGSPQTTLGRLNRAWKDATKDTFVSMYHIRTPPVLEEESEPFYDAIDTLAD